jgi:hypothetical protein
VTIDDFLVMGVMEKGRMRVRRALIRDKGHARMYRDFSLRVRSGSPCSYPDRDLLASTLVYLAVVEAASKGGGKLSISSPTFEPCNEPVNGSCTAEDAEARRENE